MRCRRTISPVGLQKALSGGFLLLQCSCVSWDTPLVLDLELSLSDIAGVDRTVWVRVPSEDFPEESAWSTCSRLSLSASAADSCAEVLASSVHKGRLALRTEFTPERLRRSGMDEVDCVWGSNGTAHAPCGALFAADSSRVYSLPSGVVLHEDDILFGQDLLYERWQLFRRTTWRGINVMQHPSDLLELHELVWEVKPDLVIETGTASGGSAYFFATLLHEIHGDGKHDTEPIVITIDAVDPEAKDEQASMLRQRPLWQRHIRFVHASSTDPATAERVAQLRSDWMAVHGGRLPRTLVVLDGPHACDDVFAELELYAGFVSSGSYCVVMDTKLDHIHAATPSAPYHSNGPLCAVRRFFSDSRLAHGHFRPDRSRERLTQYSQHHLGWLRRA